ncbi:MAG: hypothetical protein EOO77_23590 [Oxalobacteraceae bacterium]|nr:MAG: hypothetical protein EOO77_23590 [Oxalobacteraceae bacterium]
MTAGAITVIKTALAISTAVLSILAAGLWWRSAVVKVSPEGANRMREKHFAKHGRSGYATWTLFDGSDMEFTLKRQSEWSRWLRSRHPLPRSASRFTSRLIGSRPGSRCLVRPIIRRPRPLSQLPNFGRSFISALRPLLAPDLRTRMS